MKRKSDAPARRLWDAITRTIRRDDPDATCEWFLGCSIAFGVESSTEDEIHIAVNARHHEQDWLPTRWEGLPVRVVLGARGWHDL